MFARGRRLFTIASLTTILVACLHAIGNSNTAAANAGEAAVIQAMTGYTIPLGMGMAPSFWDIFRVLVHTMTVTLVALGAVGLTFAADRQIAARVLRRVAVILTITSAVLSVICYIHQIPPPLISFVVLVLLYGGATVTTEDA
jgi:hypothetical protein